MKKMNWFVDVLAYVEQCKTKPFQWGVLDCVLFAADCVVLQGNEDPALQSRGKYSTEVGAKRHLKAVYGDMFKAWDSKLTRIENVNYVQNGDVVVFPTELGDTSGIYWNGGIFAPTMDGVQYFDEQHQHIVAAWSV